MLTIAAKSIAYMMACGVLCFADGAYAMTVTSSDFAEGASIPIKFGCKGDNVPPTLSVKAIPAKAASLALTVVDPDAPSGHYVHWVVWNIPINKEFSEALKEGIQGINDAGGLGYHGPCPPAGQAHRYNFRVYALDTVVSLPDTSTREQLEGAIKGHIIDTADLNGTFRGQ